MSKPFKTLSDDFHITIAQTQDDFDLKAMAVRYKGSSQTRLTDSNLPVRPDDRFLVLAVAVFADEQGYKRGRSPSPGAPL